MNPLVSDTSPLNYLIQLGRVDILPKLFTNVVVPSEVIVELSHVRAPILVRSWVSQPPSWLKVTPVTKLLTLPVDAGEVHALSLAVELGHEQILINEARGREVALQIGLNPIGTLRVLELAAESRLIDLHASLSDLELTSFRAHPTLLQKLRAKFPR